MAGTMNTLGKAARHALIVVAGCEGCGRRRCFLPGDLADLYGSERDPRSLRFQCLKCGSGDGQTRIVPPPKDHDMICVYRPRKRQMLIWDDVTIRLG